MFVKELKTEFGGRQIAVRNAWGPALSLKAFWGEARLYIDGKVTDTAADAFSINGRVAILRGGIQIGERTHVVEVYVRAIFRTKLKICIDGKRVAGDLP